MKFGGWQRLDAERAKQLNVEPRLAFQPADPTMPRSKQQPRNLPPALIDEKIKELGDWRGKTLAKVREIIHEADPEIVEEWKWMGTPVWSHGGIVCTGETYKNVVKMTFAKGAALKDPSGLFNSSLDGNVRRAIDIHEGDKIDEAALKISSAPRGGAQYPYQGQEQAAPPGGRLKNLVPICCTMRARLIQRAQGPRGARRHAGRSDRRRVGRGERHGGDPSVRHAERQASEPILP